jgi:cyclohexyl-isocyanide hydratase
VLSISTGTLLLAATGLLGGQRAAGHWLTRDELEPFEVELSDEPIERHGRLFTTSGTPAALEAIPLLAGTILYGPVR